MDDESASLLKDFIVWLGPRSAVENLIPCQDETSGTRMGRLFREGGLHHVTKSSTDNAKFHVIPHVDAITGQEMVMLTVAEMRFGAWVARLHKGSRSAGRW